MDIGTLIAKRYRVKSAIGHGGMGQVWMADDEHLGRSVAIKTMTPASGLTPSQIAHDSARFEREAKAVARLDHTGLAAVYDLGVETGTHYLVMQYVQGLDLGDYIVERERLTLEEATAVGVQICSVLAATHSRGIVHRDLKPGNVRIRTDGVVKVLDFGVAAILDGDTQKLTTTSERLGTFQYMAPEQIMGEPVDPRTDLYALGCLLHEMLTGRPVFEHEAPLMVPSLHTGAAPEPLRALRPDASEDVENLVLELLAKKPADRPVHAGEVYRRLAVHLPAPGAPEAALVPWAEPDPRRPFRHPMAPDARPVRQWAREAGGAR
ncbi:serine/threonine-protein kinase [Streptomyces radicis]|uniref:non-specific serine/threonine protein kinase n=1 Tax=Streptomyces radicis TaxID=1750517 RepID=A0A3A9W5Q8_9ACTN|nr:serine/threonine-protein kinase [Streptomyces radicis]RKN08190.1 serine/threonine protein kinase [Streptomyces radicis]RKN20545.1 serine/threonine protein kinase [Streptomyces radicis]